MLKVLLGLYFFLGICFKKMGIDRFMDLLKFKFQMLMGKGSTLIPGGMLPGMRMQMGFFFFPSPLLFAWLPCISIQKSRQVCATDRPVQCAYLC